ncbi:hypothetical protein ACFQXA_31785 [Nocardiopsis composta]
MLHAPRGPGPPPPLSCVVLTALCAVLAGARSFAAIGQWAANAPSTPWPAWAPAPPTRPWPCAARPRPTPSGVCSSPCHPPT